MSLNSEYRAKLEQAISRLRRTILSLEGTPVDFAAIDLIDVAIGLLERQLDMDIEFIFEDEEVDEEVEDGFLFLEESSDGNVEFAPQKMKPIEDIKFADNDCDEELMSDANFSFLDESDTDIITPDELQDWFNLDFPN